MRVSQMLVIPVDGPLEVHAGGADFDMEAVLSRDGEGRRVHLNILGSGMQSSIDFLIAADLGENQRAREALFLLNKVQMVVTGVAVLSGLEDDKFVEILRSLT